MATATSQSYTGPIPIPVFAGQGIAAVNSSRTREIAFKDSQSPSGSLLLSSCHDAFLNELATLPIHILKQVNISATDFERPEALIRLPIERYFNNALISGTTLFLIQSLRYLAFVETRSDSSTMSFLAPLDTNVKSNLGVLGLSSGVLAACVVGTSSTTISYIAHAVEAYRLAFWIGVRVQVHRVTVLVPYRDLEPSLPWSLVLRGINKETAQGLISNFEDQQHMSPIFITAVIEYNCVTVSGRPDILHAFRETLPSDILVHETSLETLYHSPLHAETCTQVLEDVRVRNIQFPDHNDIKAPLRCTFTGQLIDNRSSGSESLVERVVYMILLQPVNWDLVTDGLFNACPTLPLQLLNIGPGTDLARCLGRAFTSDRLSCLDLTCGNTPHFPPKQEPIAIVGMSVNMPGAPNSAELWNILEQGINTLTEIPESRFKVSDFDPASVGKSRIHSMKARTGNFINGVEDFDHSFFRISPREAKSMDPQQRILLHAAYDALENAGYVPNSTPSFQQEHFGCYIGCATEDYVHNLRNDIDVYYSTGTLRAFLSGRISYAMQLSGPSVVVDTACSSSIVAIYQACRALMNRDCNAALAGGVNVITSPDMFIGLDRGHFLSPTGQCKSFDASADGYSRSEGCGLFVLKRLSDAIAENDNILGVIRGVEVNQSGRAHSITHPHSPTQATLFKRVLDNSGIEASRVSVVEAHGTGTRAGDPNELRSIRSIFGVGRSDNNPLYITSIKANMGHLEAASGAAGLAKLLLMFRHQTIPRQISLSTLNPDIAPLAEDGTIIPLTNTTWTVPDKSPSRLALLNNFGAAGSNGTLLVEEHIPPASVPAPADMPFVFGLSAKTEAALETLRRNYLAWLQDPSTHDISFSDIAYTTTARRQIYEHRIAVAARDGKELFDKLQTAPIVQTDDKPGNVVFVFSGQGGWVRGMGQSLYHSSLVFKHHIDECHAILVSSKFPGILQTIDPNPERGTLEEIEELEATQAAIFSLEFALAKLWLSWGVVPAAVVGHSLGEYAALVIAGVISLHAALNIVASRVRLMMKSCSKGTTGMIAVNLDLKSIQCAFDSSPGFSNLTIACYNGAADCTVSGPLDQIRDFKEYLDSSVHCKSAILTVPFGYHSDAMHPILHDLNLFASKFKLRPPTIPVLSNVHGTIVMPGDGSFFTPGYFALHCAKPVLFDQAIHSLTATPELGDVVAWIEIGPPGPLSMVERHASVSKSSILLRSLRRKQDPWIALTEGLSQLYLSSVNISWREVFAHLSTLSCADIPPYPFTKSKFWVEYREERPGSETGLLDASPHSGTEFSLLSTCIQYPSEANGHTVICQTPIKNLAHFVVGHRVGGLPLCPASVYVELSLAALKLGSQYLHLHAGDTRAILKDIEFAAPLVYDENVPRVVQTSVTLDEDGGSFSVCSYVESAGRNLTSVHAHGKLRFQPSVKVLSKFARALPVLHRRMAAVKQRKGDDVPETLSTRTIYELIFPRVVNYSKEYRSVQSFTIDSSGMEGCANFRLPHDCHRGSFVVHPTFLDTMLHVAGFLANMHGAADDAYICNAVGSVSIVPESVDISASYSVYCSNAWLPDERVVIAEAYAVCTTSSKIVARIKGMQFRKVRLSSLKRGLTQAVYASGTPPPTGNVSPMLCTPPSNDTPLPIFPTTIPKSEHLEMHAEDEQPDLKTILSSVLGLRPQDIRDDSDFESLGMDSFGSIEALQAFREQGLQLPSNFFSIYSQVLPAQEYISQLYRKETGRSSVSSGNNITHLDTTLIKSVLRLHTLPTLIQQTENSDHLPLFLIHDGSGLINYYDHIPSLNRNVWGIFNPNFISGDEWGDLRAMASRYADYIAQSTTGPILLGGWSFGGIAAFEVALQLQPRGIQVKGVVLIDSPSPRNHVPLSSTLVQSAIKTGTEIRESELSMLVKRQFEIHSRMLGSYVPLVSHGGSPPLVLLHCRDGFNPRNISDVPSWLSDRSDPRGTASAWEILIGAPVKVLEIPGHHFQPFKPINIEEVTSRISDACNYLEGLF